MGTPTNGLTDAQIAQMLDAATATPEDGQLSYRLGNQTFKAKDAQELQTQLDQAMQQIASGVQQQMATLQQQAAAAVTAAAKPAPAAQAAPSFDKEQYARLFLEDPMQAQEYLDEHRFGMRRPTEVLRTAVADIGTIEQSLAVQQFMNQHQDYEATPQNFQALQSAMQEFNLPWNYNGMRLAYSHAKANGQIASEAYQEPAQQYAQPQGRRGVPSVPRGQANAVSVDEDVMSRFESLPADKMKAFLEQLQYGG